MKLSICIVHHRQPEFLERFVDSISSFPPSFEFEVIVVDNSCRSDSFGQVGVPAFLERFSRHRNFTCIIEDVNRGFGHALNAAASQAKGEYIAFCNADLVASDGAFDRLVRYLEEHPHVGIVGPQLVYADGTVQDSYRRFPRLRDVVVKRLGLSRLFYGQLHDYLMWYKDSSRTEPVDWIVGALMVMSRTVFERVGGFDERFFLFFEDTDLCRRVLEAGFQTVYVAESSFLHAEKRLSDQGNFVSNLFRTSFWHHVASAFKYFWKWKWKKKVVPDPSVPMHGCC